MPTATTTRNDDDEEEVNVVNVANAVMNGRRAFHHP